MIKSYRSYTSAEGPMPFERKWIYSQEYSRAHLHLGSLASSELGGANMFMYMVYASMELLFEVLVQ
jgi:hypothetical protein